MNSRPPSLSRTRPKTSWTWDGRVIFPVPVYLRLVAHSSDKGAFERLLPSPLETQPAERSDTPWLLVACSFPDRAGTGPSEWTPSLIRRLLGRVLGLVSRLAVHLSPHSLPPACTLVLIVVPHPFWVTFISPWYLLCCITSLSTMLLVSLPVFGVTTP
jgi:hypothetical protein